jgi:CCR4-NOT transcription complex subunit 1
MIAGILSMLAEIHAMPRLKLNISFVIEMTFKTFEVSLADVCPSTALRDLPRVQMHNPDFSALPEAKAPAGAALNPALVPPGAPPALTPPPGAMPGAAGAAAAAAAGPPGTPPPPAAGAAAGSATPGEGGKGAAGAVPASPGVAAAGAAAGTPSASPAGAAAGAGGAAASPAAGMPAAAAAAASAAEPGLLTKLHTYVQISPQLGVLAERLSLKRLVPIAVDRAMCEIITPIVERSVTIACMTTYELVTKDYANDPDESRLRAAAHLMVSSLAGSLALVTCKEPLRVSLSNQLKAMLQPSMDPATLAQAVEVSRERGGRRQSFLQLVGHLNSVPCFLLLLAAGQQVQGIVALHSSRLWHGRFANVLRCVCRCYLCYVAALQLLVNDNLDLGCTIIERAATDKAVRDIDKSLAQVGHQHQLAAALVECSCSCGV